MSVKKVVGTSYSLWEDRDELEALGLNYFRLGKFAVEIKDLEKSIWNRRAIKKLIINNDAYGDQGVNEKTVNTSALDFFIGSNGIDIITARNNAAEFTANLGAGNDQYYGMKGADIVFMGDGYFDFAKTGQGNDVIYGGDGMDFVSTEAGNDIFYGGQGNDHAYLGSNDDLAYGGEGIDWITGDAGNDRLYGGADDDWLEGRTGDDYLEGGEGEDLLEGGDGDDILVFRSDAGTPTDLVDDEEAVANMFKGGWKDTAIGGKGSDSFHFIYEMDATLEIIEKHTDKNGKINWMPIMRENENFHDHWVNWGGVDLIKDFNPDEDKLILEGHTVGYMLDYVDTDKDGVYDTTHIIVYSDQALMVANSKGIDVKDLPEDLKMAHDRDLLGAIIVEGQIIDQNDITLVGGGAAKTEFLYENGDKFNELVDYFGDDLWL